MRWGVALGFCTPLLSAILYYFIRFYPLFSVAEVWAFLGREKNQITALTIPCLVLNIALFTLYVNTQRDETAKGIFGVTLIYAIATLLLKFLL